VEVGRLVRVQASAAHIDRTLQNVNEAVLRLQVSGVSARSEAVMIQTQGIHKNTSRFMDETVFHASVFTVQYLHSNGKFRFGMEEKYFVILKRIARRAGGRNT
jgi:hypothetical protein